MILDNYFFKRKVRKLVEASRARKHKYCSLEETESILVLYRYEDKKYVEPTLNKLRQMKKKLYSCITCPGPVADNDSSVVYIDRYKDVDKHGIPHDEIGSRVAKIPADILIDLSRGKCHTLRVLLLQHPSLFKVGERLEDNSVYDFSIILTDGGTVGDLFEYLLFYLQTIRSK